ncbi:MAG: DUF87 domain-containing protein [Bacilli bacterium]|nr:DUF87 domain-containing protein [Bacilli bacterium]
MFDKITYISNDGCNVKLKDGVDVSQNLMNMHLIFEDDTKKILGEVDDLDGNTLKAHFLGEIAGNRLLGGTIRKPTMDATVRVIDRSEIPLITGTDGNGWMPLGTSPFYDGFPVFLDVNNFFSNHFAIFGNTGSGKSCGVSRLFQNMFHDERLNPYKANILIFDSSGEYYNAFNNLSTINGRYNYRFISTNETDGQGEKLRLPVYLLNKDDLALLLQCTSHSQLPIIERMLKLALVFSQNDMDSNAYKNHLIAKAIMSILYTNETAPNKRNEIFSILGSCSTDEFNLEAPVQGIGYVRKFRECFLIDNSGNFSERVLLTEYVNSFIKEEFDDYEPHTGVFYTLDTLEKALNFTLISEGWLRNEQTYGDSVTLRVRLHSLIVGDNAKFFDVKEYVSLETYLSSLLIQGGRKYQIVNINLSDIDDDFAKVLTKIYSRLVFDFAKGLKNRGSIPFHIILEEAHRYIQADHDRFLFGYNIFERIAKEGRKYGVILGIITQRPVELSDNVISQCTNFLIFKINHPMDIKYIREMVPHITDEIIEKQKSLQPGTCLGFGLGFKIPLIIKMEMPNPSPLSGNCDVVNIWCGGSTPKAEVPESIPVPTTPVSEPEIPKVVEPVQEKKEEEIEIMEPILPKEEPIEVMEPTTPKEEIIEIMDEPKEKEVEVMDEPTDSLEAMANNTPNLFSNSVIVPEKNTGDISDFISNGALQDIVETEPNGEIVSSADTMVEDVVNQIDDEEEKSSFDEDDGNKATSFFHMPPEETTEETPFTPVEADKIQPDFSSIAKLDDDPVDDGGSDSSNDLIALNLDGTAA